MTPKTIDSLDYLSKTGDKKTGKRNVQKQKNVSFKIVKYKDFFQKSFLNCARIKHNRNDKKNNSDRT